MEGSVILFKLAIISIELFYSAVSLADNTSDKATMRLKCHEITKLRCLEVQEYGHRFVGPLFDDKTSDENISITTKKPSDLEITCCEKSMDVVAGHFSNNEPFIGPLMPKYQEQSK